MSKPNNARNLPKVVLEDLIARVRASNYQGIDNHLDWLKAQGHRTVSRSGLGRFFMHLQREDGKSGDVCARVFKRRGRLKKSTTAHQDRVQQLWAHLVQLRAEETALMAELAQLAGQTHEQDAGSARKK